MDKERYKSLAWDVASDPRFLSKRFPPLFRAKMLREHYAELKVVDISLDEAKKTIKFIDKGMKD